ncbi:AAA family ATPase [uncultured Neglectibacter sp.]|uniref:AAA family ATPase n=1 Tax=uncultured Neglectibacter sp. TaxID=1924108 RepID=UPI0034DED279
MKNDIDDLLEAMFRGGKLNLKSSAGEKQERKPKTPAEKTSSAASGSGGVSLEWDPAENSAQAQRALDAVEQVNGGMPAMLQRNIEQLTQAANDDLKELEQRLQQDGVAAVSAGNGGSEKDLEAAFAAAEKEAGEQVLGQDEFLSALIIAFKRPFVAGAGENAPLCRAAVLGKPGTGKHSALSAIAASLGRQGVLKSPKLTAVDLGNYREAGSEKLFIQDLYAALKSGASGLVFEHFESCHPSVLPLVSALFREGEVPLPSRYAEQKGLLVDIGNALAPGVISSLSGAGKYLFLVTEKPETRLADSFGMPFLSALDDICETKPFSPESLLAIADRALQELCAKAEKQLHFTLTYDDTAKKALADAFRPEQGAAALRDGAEQFYGALSEAKLRQGLSGLSGKLTGDENGLLLTYERDGEEAVLRAAGDTGDAAREAAIESVKQELSEIVGLTEIKEYILSLEDNFKIQQMRREKGLKAESPSMHMIFTGNPGTGKTTVARIVSRYLKAIGVLQGGQLIEVTRADLVGRYVGHTAPLTQKAIQSALGGVLFIDEAYSLFRGKDDSFGLEAIDTLVKGMEDHRDDLLVILAGYSREMEEFLTANSGLRSRFPNLIEFPDYTAEELLEITRSIVKGKGYRLAEDCDKPLLAYYGTMQREGDPRTNGNGRMARNKVEDAILNCSRRNMKLPPEQRDLELLLRSDFELEESAPPETAG